MEFAIYKQVPASIAETIAKEVAEQKKKVA
jgi:hypothetical protein